MVEKQKAGALGVKYLHYELAHCRLVSRHFLREVRVKREVPSKQVNCLQLRPGPPPAQEVYVAATGVLATAHLTACVEHRVVEIVVLVTRALTILRQNLPLNQPMQLIRLR